VPEAVARRLGFCQLQPTPETPEIAAFQAWLLTWRGIGDIVTGMERHGYALALRKLVDDGWNGRGSSTGCWHRSPPRTHPHRSGGSSMPRGNGLNAKRCRHRGLRWWRRCCTSGYATRFRPSTGFTFTVTWDQSPIAGVAGWDVASMHE